MGNTPNVPQPSLIGTPGGTTGLGSGAGVQTDSSGLPVITGTTGGLVGGQVSLWDYVIPPEIQGRTIWFDYKKVVNEGLDIPHQAPSTVVKEHELATPMQIYKQFAQISIDNPTEFMALQAALHVTQTGQMDDSTQSALGKYLVDYMRVTKATGSAIPFMDWLLKPLKQTAQGKGGTGSTKKPTYKVTDPTEIASIAQNAAQSSLGMALTPDQINQFVQEFQKEQQNYEASAVTGGGSVSAPVLTTEAEAYAQQADPKAYHHEKMQSYMDALARLLGDSYAPSTPLPPPSISSNLMASGFTGQGNNAQGGNQPAAQELPNGQPGPQAASTGGNPPPNNAPNAQNAGG